MKSQLRSSFPSNLNSFNHLSLAIVLRLCFPESKQPRVHLPDTAVLPHDERVNKQRR